MRKIKTLIALLLTLTILTPFTVFSAENSQKSEGPSVTPAVYRNEDYYYQITQKGTVSIFMYMGEEKDVIIPSTIEGLPVTNIDTLAFSGTKIKSVLVPESVNSIGAEAFANCQELKEATLKCNMENSLGEAIGYGLFRNCVNLKKVTLSESIQTIQFYMFYGCRALNEVNLSSKLQIIGGGAFAYCDSLYTLNLSLTRLSYIGQYAFYRSGISVLFIPESLRTIGKEAFAYNEDYLEILFPTYNSGWSLNYPLTIEEDAFVDCDYVSTNIPELQEYLNNLPPTSINPGSTPTEPTVTEPTVTEPTVTEPTATEPTVTEPTVTEPTATEPIATEPIATEPINTTPGATSVDNPTEPAVTNPVCSEPAISDWKPNTSDKYTPGTEYYFGDDINFSLTNYYTANKNNNYKTDLEKQLLAVAWDVRTIGDANYDGKISIKDATLIQKFSAKLISENQFNYKNADVDTDGTVNVKDATAIQKMVAKII